MSEPTAEQIERDKWAEFMKLLASTSISTWVDWSKVPPRDMDFTQPPHHTTTADQP